VDQQRSNLMKAGTDCLQQRCESIRGSSIDVNEPDCFGGNIKVGTSKQELNDTQVPTTTSGHQRSTSICRT